MEKVPGHGLWYGFPAARPAGPRTSYPPAPVPAPISVPVPPRSLLENGSLLAFPIRNEHHGGDVHENGCFPIRKCVLQWTKPRSGAIPSFKMDH